jgi:Cu-processing system permease protein
MRAMWVLAANTYREVIRDRILYGLIVFAFLLIGLSLALGQLSFAEQARISANFGLSAIHLCAVVLAIFVGSNLVAKEIEKKTILTILVRPISRLQFIMGKALGLSLLILTMLMGLSLVLVMVFWGLGVPVNARLGWVLLGLWSESMVLLGVTLVFSMISKPLLVVCYSVGIFMIGHWQSSMAFFAERSEGEVLKAIAWTVTHFLPNFERVNWKDIVIYDQPVDYSANLLSIGYMMVWFAVCISFCAILFKRKDLG